MTLIASPDYPELRVHIAGANVKFRDGRAEVDESVADRLLALDDLGLVIADDEGDDPKGDGAASTGSDDDDLSAMDEAQLRALAEEEGIDLGKLQNVDKIRAKIAAELAD